jgi:hypothetical protein
MKHLMWFLLGTGFGVWLCYQIMTFEGLLRGYP